MRTALPNERQSVTRKFSVNGTEGYLVTGLYDDGTVGEIYIYTSKAGSTIRGLLDAFATMTSIALQYGVPLADLVNKFSGTRFEPMGYTNDENVKTAESMIDYVFQYLAWRFPDVEMASTMATEVPT